MISLIVALIIAGALLYLLNALVPMDPKFKTAINVLVALVLFLYCLQVLGIWNSGIRLR
jgi:uncharacterized protein YhhL (DUF1145 family)